jgi:hypothetical protein
MIYWLVVIAVFLPSVVFGQSTIGSTSIFSLEPLQVLTTDPVEYGQAFNFFFSIEVFFGLFALFIRLILRVFRM